MKQKQVVGVLAVTAAASSGDTIALIAPIVLTDSLMVPSGVTLDITAANAALVLEDDAVFTVNGTVNAKGTGYESYGIVMMPGTTTATINGSGVIHLKTQGAPLCYHERAEAHP